MQTVSNGDILHEMSYPVFWENLENISICCLRKILPRVLSVKHTFNPRNTITLNTWSDRPWQTVQTQIRCHIM